MSFLQVSNIGKKDDRGFELKDISFTQHRFQKIAVAGETGSGKSTLLKIIAGLVQPDSGEVLFEDKRIKGPAEKLIPGHPAIGYLSQHFELRNHYRVSEELDYTNSLAEEEAAEIYAICRISHLLNRWTNQLSGGERQRIVLARLLIAAPKLLLLDEPFSNLDSGHKAVMKSVIHDIASRLNISIILISHDPLDVLSWADEIIVMKNGIVVQKDNAQTIYNQPTDAYTASLFGHYNLLKPGTAKAFDNNIGAEKQLFVRPENFKITTESNNSVYGKVEAVQYFGSYYELLVQLSEERIKIKTHKSFFKIGDEVFVSLSSDNHWFI